MAQTFVKVMRLRWKHIKTGVLFLVFDALVIIASWIVFRDLTVAFYAGVAVAVDSVVMDYVLYGPDEAKLIYIISDHPQRIRRTYSGRAGYHSHSYISQGGLLHAG